MPASSDSTPDFNWIRRELGDSAVLPTSDDAKQPDDAEAAPAQETDPPATDTIHSDSFVDREKSDASGSGSNIHDVELSDASILDEDSLVGDEKPLESTDVIQREQAIAEEGDQNEAAQSSADADSSTTEEASDSVPVVHDEAGVESQPVTEQTDAESVEPPLESAAAVFTADVESVKAFDLETPTPAAGFPTPSVPIDPSQARDLRGAKTRGTKDKSEPAASPEGKSIGIIVLVSYASAMTILCLFLLMQLMKEFRPHQLESLPDVPPLGEGQSQFYPADAVLPGGHVLQLEDARRFGDILVEPLRVTYGPLQYEHWTGEASRVRPPSEMSVVKLWLRLTNESKETSIAPLDARLVLNSRYRSGEMLTNSFLRPADSTTNLELMHSLPAASEWELQGQEMGLVLGPGESFETYIATDFEHLSDVVGVVGSDHRDLVWRLHLRKGYGPAGQGVTTLVEVTFNGSDIELEG